MIPSSLELWGIVGGAKCAKFDFGWTFERSFVTKPAHVDMHQDTIFFNACILRSYLSEPLTSLSCSLNAIIPCLKIQEHLRLRYCNFFDPFYNLNCSAWERAPWRRVTEKRHLFHSKRRSVRDRESNPGHLLGQQRRKTLSHPLRLIRVRLRHQVWF
jgi:hypothetical protein